MTDAIASAMNATPSPMAGHNQASADAVAIASVALAAQLLHHRAQGTR